MNVTSASQLHLKLAPIALALLLFATGCEQRTTVNGEIGELGRLVFTYARSCFFGCLLDQPLLVGTRETIRIEGEAGNAPKVDVRSTDESVAEVALERQCYCEREDTTGRIDVALDGMCEEPWQMVCENKILVGARAAGDAKIEVLREDGSVLDRVTVHVKEAARARFFGTLPDALGEEAGDSFSLEAESRLELRLELYDEDGIELLAPEGVTWRVTDPEVARLNVFLVGSGDEVVAGRDVVVETLAAGETTVEIDVPGLTAAIDVEVTD
jgi:hypothetical protein